MVTEFAFTNPKMLSFYESFPRDFTCWQVGKAALEDKAEFQRFIHRTIVVRIGIGGAGLAWVAFELDAFRFKRVKRLMRKR